MDKTRPEDKPKIIALSVALLAAVGFIGSTVLKFNREQKVEEKRTMNANLVLHVPSVTESAGSMVMWRTAKWPIPDPFRSNGREYVRPSPVYSAPPPRPASSNSGQPVPQPEVKKNARGPQPLIILKGVILSDNGLGAMAIFEVGPVTKTMRSGQPIVPGVILGRITPDGVAVTDLGKAVSLSVNESYKPIE